MTQTNITVQTLARYINDFERDELRNEPARLLCEYLVSELDLGEDSTTMECALSNWLKNVNLDALGDAGELGGVVVTAGIGEDIVEYENSYDTTFITASTLLQLAEEADRTGNPAPVPSWYDEAWKGITLRLAEERVTEMTCAEIMAVLAAEQVPVRIEDGIPEFKVGFHWFDDPKAALLDLVVDRSAIDRAKVLNRF